MKQFRFTLEELYIKTDKLIEDIQKTEGIQKEFLISDLLEISSELVFNNCKNFIKSKGADELSADDLYISATSFALMNALDTFDFEVGIHFLKYWQIVMERRFIGEFEKATSKKEKKYQNDVCSSDAEIDGEGNTILSYKDTEEDVAEEVCTNMLLGDLIKEFESIDKYGKLIRCEMIGTQSIKTTAILRVLETDTYGSKERKIVQRTKERFKKFIISKGVADLIC